jgi:hypothetical protein
MMEIEGGTPQKSGDSARGVSLTRPESAFLAFLAPDPNRDDDAFTNAGFALGLTEEEISYIDEWVFHHGVHWETCESAGFDAQVGHRVIRNPLVVKLLTAASEKGLCVGLYPSREEIAFYEGQRLRNPFLPISIQQKSSEILMKLFGYAVDSKGGGGATVNIVVSNPYAAVNVEANQ